MNRDIKEAPIALAGPLLTIAAELNIPGYQAMSVREIVNAILDEADKVNGIRDGCYKCGTASNLITICEDCNIKYCYQCYIEISEFGMVPTIRRGEELKLMTIGDEEEYIARFGKKEEGDG